MQGGGPQPEENPTGTIPGDQAIKQQAERICRNEANNKRKELKHARVNQETKAELQNWQ